MLRISSASCPCRLVTAFLGILCLPVTASAQVTTRITAGPMLPAGMAAGDSYAPSVSGNGRYIAFQSNAMNLVAGKMSGTFDIFVRDNASNVTLLVSESDDDPGGAQDMNPSISADGRYVAYETQLGGPDGSVWVRDLVNGTLTRADVASDGSPGSGSKPSISANGRYVAFQSGAANLVPDDTNDETDVFVRDLQANTTIRVSISTAGIQGDLSSYNSTISADGRYVAFRSTASLVTGDSNASPDIYLRDTVANTTVLVSVSTGGDPANDPSDSPSISADGRNVAFLSHASTLVSGDTNDAPDIFIRDTVSNTTRRVSRNTAGAQANLGSGFPSISADGRYVAFESNATNLVANDTNVSQDIFLRDTVGNTTVRISAAVGGAAANSWSATASLSADGQRVAFASSASNLVAGDTNEWIDVFVRDTPASSTSLASVAGVPMARPGNAGSGDPVVSADGKRVAYMSEASNLVANDKDLAADVFLWDAAANTSALASVAGDGSQANDASDSPAISADGRYVAFRSAATNLVGQDANSASDIFVRDIAAGTTAIVSVATGGAQANGDSFDPSFSADGRFVAFLSAASNLVVGDTNGVMDVFLRDTLTGVTRRVSVAPDGTQASGASDAVAISADGRIVAFQSLAADLVTGDTNDAYDVFVRDTLAGTTTRISVATGGAPGNGHSFGPSLSADGRFIAYYSLATNLAPGDTNDASDVFVRDLRSSTTTCVSRSTTGALGNHDSYLPSISADGRFIAFESAANNLVPGDANTSVDVFVRDTAIDATVLVSLIPNGSPGDAHSSSAAISADGRYVAFSSAAGNLVAGDLGAVDVFLRGPLSSSPLPYRMEEAAAALRVSAGLAAGDAGAATRLDAERSGSSADRVDLMDAARIARKVAGWDQNP